jgi:DNA-binding transcriptional MerR regulator
MALPIFTARYLMAFVNFISYQVNMDTRNFSQITFEFSDVPTDQGTIPSLGVRVKTLKNDTEMADAVEVVKKEEVPQPVARQEVAVVKKSTRGRKSLKALDAEADLVNIPADEILFQRQYYSIGEVADMFKVNQSLLRFWENEFDIIQPRKNRKGDRHFRPIDIKNLELIYDLLRRRKLTIEGAKDFIKRNSRVRESFEMIQSMQSLKGFLLEIKAAL